MLDEMGAMIVAEYLGNDQRQVGYRDDQKRTLIDGQRLRHTRIANSFFHADDLRGSLDPEFAPRPGVAR
jgi:hypothetical protein